MLIGVPKEIKNNEFRVGLTPSSVNDYVHAGHRVLVEQGAGLGSGFRIRNISLQAPKLLRMYKAHGRAIW